MRVLLITVFLVLTDQITKLLVKGVSIPFLGIMWHGMQYGASIPVLGDFLRWTYIENAGMAFGIDLGGKLFFSIFSIVASVAIVIYLYKSRTQTLLLRIPLAMILGGAIGNLIDRMFYSWLFDGGKLFYGRVVDFIDVDFLKVNFLGIQLTRWPVFNIADASVTTGVILLLIFYKRIAEQEAQNLSAVPESQTADQTAGPDADANK